MLFHFRAKNQDEGKGTYWLLHISNNSKGSLIKNNSKYRGFKKNFFCRQQPKNAWQLTNLFLSSVKRDLICKVQWTLRAWSFWNHPCREGSLHLGELKSDLSVKVSQSIVIDYLLLSSPFHRELWPSRVHWLPGNFCQVDPCTSLSL